MLSNRQATANRRAKIMADLTNDDLVILVGAPHHARNADTKYIYRQDSNFYYLTGFSEPQAVAVFSPGRAEGEYVLFNLPKDPDKEVWTGRRVGQQGAVEQYDANQAFSIEELTTKLPELMLGKKNIYVQSYVEDRSEEERIVSFSITKSKLTRHDLDAMMMDMRVIKDAYEIETMRKAVYVTGLAHVNAMRRCTPGVYEYEVEAALMQKFYQGGSRAQAYPNIVASGPNSCILHYETNDRLIADGDLVLIDAAAEFDTYASDITRTFPANGKFSTEQRIIYEIVLRAQQAGIAAVAPGVTFKQVRDAVKREITKGLLDAGLLSGDLEKLIEDNACGKFFIHSFGHWIGLDVHDVGDKADEDGNAYMRKLEPGMMTTMEPGIYIPDTMQDVDPKWHNIGVRIEDMLLVTNDGCEVMSAQIPKSVEEIEHVMKEAWAKRFEKQIKMFGAWRPRKPEMDVANEYHGSVTLERK